MAQSVEIQNIINLFKQNYHNGNCTLAMRPINQDTLRKLEWIDSEALKYVNDNLKVEHYQSGPEPPHIRKGRLKTGSVWKFRMPIFSEKAQVYLDVYVKFHHCKDGTVFISFHEST